MTTTPSTAAATSPTRTLSTWRALNNALIDVMSEDPTVFVMGEDLTTWGTGGGTYGITGKLLAKFGSDRIGTDVSVVATQLMRRHALAAAELLAEEEGISVEVVDPRTLFPLDMETIAASVRKTGRVLVAHEAPQLFGFGGELVAQLTRQLWGELKAAPRRLGGARTPIPYVEVQESAVVPNTQRVIDEITALVKD